MIDHPHTYRDGGGWDSTLAPQHSLVVTESLTTLDCHWSRTGLGVTLTQLTPLTPDTGAGVAWPGPARCPHHCPDCSYAQLGRGATHCLCCCE